MYITNIPHINQPLNRNPANFTGRKNIQAQKPVVPNTNNGLKRLVPWIFGMMGMCCGSAYSGGNSQTFNGVEDSLGIHVQYTDVSKEIRDSVMKPLYQLKAKLNKNNDFLNGIKIDVTNDFDNLEPSDKWREHIIDYESDVDFMGTSFYSDKKIPKRIAIQEKSHSDYITVAKNGKETILPAMRHTLMHEAGHHFNSFFGHNHNDKLALQWDSILSRKNRNLMESPYGFDMNMKDESIDDAFEKINELSDKQEYKKAFFKDINNLKNIPENKLPKDIDYYIGDLAIEKVIPWQKIEEADALRDEAYANLFAYVIGENDGDKEKFVKCFSNCHGIVKKDIAKFLKLVK